MGDFVFRILVEYRSRKIHGIPEQPFHKTNASRFGAASSQPFSMILRNSCMESFSHELLPKGLRDASSMAGERSMKRFCEFCTNVRVVGAEIASTIVFLVFLYVAARYEITHLLQK